jgi:hypothetical protein
VSAPQQLAEHTLHILGAERPLTATLAPAGRHPEQITGVLLREIGDDLRDLLRLLRVEPGPVLQRLHQLAPELFLHRSFSCREVAGRKLPARGAARLVPQPRIPHCGAGIALGRVASANIVAWAAASESAENWTNGARLGSPSFAARISAWGEGNIRQTNQPQDDPEIPLLVVERFAGRAGTVRPATGAGNDDARAIE